MERYTIGTVALVVTATLAFVAYTIAGGARAGSGAAGMDEFRREVAERLNGAGLTFVPGSPPTDQLGEGAAVAAARQEMGPRAQSEPIATYGRLTDPLSRNGPPEALVVDRPVWVVSYPQVIMAIYGTSRGGPDAVPATADVIIDAKTGDFIRSHLGSLAPVGPQPTATFDCSKLPC